MSTLFTKKLKNNNALDFDDILVKTYRLLTEDAETLEYYADKFRYIHVDEFQDTNRIQYLIIKRLASKAVMLHSPFILLHLLLVLPTYQPDAGNCR